MILLALCLLRSLTFCRSVRTFFPAEIPPGLPPLRRIEHQIDLIPGAALPNRAAYRTNPEETKEIQQQLQDLLDRGGYHQIRRNLGEDQKTHGGGLMGHFRAKKTEDVLATHFFWPKMRRDFERFVGRCTTCQEDRGCFGQTLLLAKDEERF